MEIIKHPLCISFQLPGPVRRAMTIRYRCGSCVLLWRRWGTTTFPRKTLQCTRMWIQRCLGNGQMYLFPPSRHKQRLPLLLLPGPKLLLNNQNQLQSNLVKELLEIHRFYVDVLLSMGVDPLKEYQYGVKYGDTRCKVCEKTCSSTQKLKNHIRRCHIGKTPYLCGDCNKYYGDSQSLKVHLRKHLPEGEKEAAAHKCPTCNKSYSSVGKLNKHLEKHADIRCRFCNKYFAYNRMCKAHEAESCPQRPGAKEQDDPQEEGATAAAAPTKRWYCHICDSDYGAHRNLKKHLNMKHGGAEVAKGACC